MEVVRSYLFVVTTICLQGQVKTQYHFQECVDESNFYQCYSWFIYGYCQHEVYYSDMLRRCRRTCGLCHTTRATMNSSVRRVIVNGRSQIRAKATCQDKNSHCDYYKGLGYCVPGSMYYDFMKGNCALTCGICKAACKDNNSNCPGWKVYCDPSSRYWAFMQKDCRKTCGICKDGSGSGGGGGGGGSGGSSGKRELACDFEKNFCHWINQPFDDAADWKVGKAANGPASGANGSANYAYVDSPDSNFKARLLLPLELVLPDGVTSKGTMCFNFKFQTGSGTLKVIEERYPTLNDKYPSSRTVGTFQGSGTWVDGKTQVTIDDKHQIVLEGETGTSGRVVVDNIAFISGNC